MSAERILVIEDDLLVRNLLCAKLSEHGFEVAAAGTAAEALLVTRTCFPEVVILDLTLLDADPFSSVMDGFAALSLLRRNRPEAALTVIVHTADPSPEVEARAKALKIDAVVRKGISCRELAGLIRRKLDERTVAPTAR